jgi:hypothetical protein
MTRIWHTASRTVFFGALQQERTIVNNARKSVALRMGISSIPRPQNRFLRAQV